MKTMKWLMVMVLMTGVLALVGCGKKSTPQNETITLNGVQVAMPALQKSLMTSQDKDVQASAGKLAYGLRYGNFASVQEELGKLAANPSLNADQKKLVETVSEQMKQAAANAKPAQ